MSNIHPLWAEFLESLSNTNLKNSGVLFFAAKQVKEMVTFFQVFESPVNQILLTKNGNLSPYDDLFKAAASTYGWDWKILASLCFQ